MPGKGKEEQEPKTCTENESKSYRLHRFRTVAQVSTFDEGYTIIIASEYIQNRHWQQTSLHSRTIIIASG
jgi:hypothetical protein